MKWIDNFCDDFFLSSQFSTHDKKKCGIYADSAKLTILVELPGCKKDDIEIYPSGSMLTVKAKRKLNLETKNFQNGYEFNNYETSIEFNIERILQSYDIENLEAEYQDGILTINFKKIEKPTKKVVIK